MGNYIQATESKDYIWNRMLYLAGKRNIYVYKTEFSGTMRGFFFYDSHHKISTIFLDSSLGKKQNIVMAHELGHAMLHRGQGSLIMGYECSNKDVVARAEREANRFALKLINLLSKERC